MMKVSIKVNKLEEEQSLSGLFQSMILKRLGEYNILQEVQIEVQNTDDSRVPIKVSLKSCLINGEIVNSSAASINYLSAFTQALSRMERQMQKRILVRRA